MRILFICNQGKHRSKTAAEIFAKTFETDYAGLYNETPVTNEQLNHADIICVMEEHQKETLHQRFPNNKKPVIILHIPDVYHYQQPELIKLLQQRLRAYSSFQKK